MATLITAIGTSLAGAGGAAAAGAAATSLSTALSIGTGIASIFSGVASFARARTANQFAQAEAAQEEAAGEQQARDYAREYAELRSEQQAIQLGNGLDISVGTPASIGEAGARRADRSVKTARQTARNRSSMARLRGRGLLAEGRASMLGGIVDAAGVAQEQLALVG